MMINNTIRKLPSSIIFDARSGGYSIRIKCTATMNSKLAVVDSMAYRYKGNCMSQHTSPRQNPEILLCLRGVATPMCHEKMTRNSVHLFFNWPFKHPAINIMDEMCGRLATRGFTTGFSFPISSPIDTK